MFSGLRGLREAVGPAPARTADATPEATPLHFVPVRVLPEPTTATAAPTSAATDDGSADAVEVLLSAGRRLRVGPGFDGPTLTRLLALLEEGQP